MCGCGGQPSHRQRGAALRVQGPLIQARVRGDLGCWGGGEVFTSGPLEEGRPVSEGCGVGLAEAVLA